jgi:hypothetical protein
MAIGRKDPRDVMKGYATTVKQTQELLKTAGKLEASDETALLVKLLQQQMDLGEAVLKKLSGISGELTTIREVLKAGFKER